MSIKLKNSELIDCFNAMIEIVNFMDSEKIKISDPKIEYWFLRLLKKMEQHNRFLDEIRNKYIKELGELVNDENYEIKDEEKRKEFFDKMQKILDEEYEIEGNIYKKNAEEVFEALGFTPLKLKYRLIPIVNFENEQS